MVGVGVGAGRKGEGLAPPQAPEPAATPDPSAVVPDIRVDFPEYVVAEAGGLLDVAYRDHINDNNSTHLDRGILLDEEW